MSWKEVRLGADVPRLVTAQDFLISLMFRAWRRRDYRLFPHLLELARDVTPISIFVVTC